MRIKVPAFELDVDVDGWALEYDLDAGLVPADVAKTVKAVALDHIARLGLLAPPSPAPDRPVYPARGFARAFLNGE